MSEDFDGGAGFEGGSDQGTSDAGGASQGQSGAHEAGSHSAATSGHESAPDWRASYLEGIDEGSKDRASKFLQRYKGHSDVLKSALEGQKKIGELSESLRGRIKVPSSENDDPADVEAFRRAIGVPGEAGDYTIPQIDGYNWDDGQKADINEFLQGAHAEHFTQRQIDFALTALANANAMSMRDFGRRGEAITERTEAALRQTWGREYHANREMANREMVRIFGEHAPDVANIRLADGSFLGDNTWFALGMGAQGRLNSDQGMLDHGDSRSEGQSRDQRLDELIGLQTSDYKKYKSKAVQDEIKQLVAAQLNQGRRGR